MKTLTGIGLALLGLMSFPANILAVQKLVLSVESPGSLTQFSAISVDVIVRNEGDVPVALAMFPTPSDLTLEVQLAASGEVVYRGNTSPRTGKENYRRPVNLGPGESSRFRTALAVRWSPESKATGALFDHPATYTLTFHYPLQLQKGDTIEQVLLTSPPSKIEIIGPGPSQARALDQLRQLSPPELVLDPDGVLRGLDRAAKLRAATTLRSFVQEWPSSPWTPLAQYALASILKELALEPGRISDRGMVTEASAHLDALSNAAGFPYARSVTALRTYLAKTLEPERAGPSGAVQPERQTNVTTEAKQYIVQGLQKIADSLRGGNPEQFQQLLSSDFLMNDRMDRSSVVAELAADRSRLGGALDVQVELLSAAPDGAGFTVEARFRFKAGTRTDTQVVRIKGSFTETQVQLNRWNRISSSPSL